MGRSAYYAKRLYIVAGRKFVRAKCVSGFCTELSKLIIIEIHNLSTCQYKQNNLKLQ